MRREINYIYCMLDRTDNSYDYETDGLWTDDKDVVTIWFKAGVDNVVKLDPLSMELLEVLNCRDWFNHIKK